MRVKAIVSFSLLFALLLCLTGFSGSDSLSPQKGEVYFVRSDGLSEANTEIYVHLNEDMQESELEEHVRDVWTFAQGGHRQNGGLGDLTVSAATDEVLQKYIDELLKNENANDVISR